MVALRPRVECKLQRELLVELIVLIVNHPLGILNKIDNYLHFNLFISPKLAIISSLANSCRDV